MRIVYYEVNSFLKEPLSESVSAIGFFDGLHRGHQELVNKTIEVAKEKGLKSSLITFSPSPGYVLGNQKEALLSTVSERLKLAENLGLDQVIVLKFTRTLSQLSPESFHNKIINVLNIKHIVCGEDFRYGFKGAGSIETLKQVENLGLSIINDFKENDQRISSSLIKENITEKNIEDANELLGYTYFIEGFVKHGRKLGRTIGFPTINLDYPKNKILIQDGVYIGYTRVEGKNYVSTINVGHNPTVNTVEEKSIESFVHDFEADVYQKRVTFNFVKRIRAEMKFESVQELIDQMNQDIKKTEDYFDKETRGRFNIETI